MRYNHNFQIAEHFVNFQSRHAASHESSSFSLASKTHAAIIRCESTFWSSLSVQSGVCEFSPTLITSDLMLLVNVFWNCNCDSPLSSTPGSIVSNRAYHFTFYHFKTHRPATTNMTKLMHEPWESFRNVSKKVIHRHTQIRRKSALALINSELKNEEVRDRISLYIKLNPSSVALEPLQPAKVNLIK